jgi:hypothetical protein
MGKTLIRSFPDRAAAGAQNVRATTGVIAMAASANIPNLAKAPPKIERQKQNYVLDNNK